MKRILATLALLSLIFVAWSQTTREIMLSQHEKCAGLYLPYPDNVDVSMTPPPSGYQPFYISHYGRHGSRFLPAESDYLTLRRLFSHEEACGNLTERGREVARRVAAACDDAQGRAGELAPLGYRQQRGIAERMYCRFPQVFSDSACVTAVSSVYMRCAHSMFAFVQRLKELNCQLNVPVESSQRNMDYLNPLNQAAREYYAAQPFQPGFDRFRKSMIRPGRLMESLFVTPFTGALKDSEAQSDFMWAMYLLAIDLPNTGSGVDLYDIFTPEELFDLWQVFNYEYYTKHSCNPDNGGVFTGSVKALLEKIVDDADSSIEGRCHGATLRFGHDSALIPLAGLLGIPEASGRENIPEQLYKTYADFRVSPMGANIQLIFYRRQQDGSDGDILVKFLLNESEVMIGGVDTDTYPYYRWADVRASFLKLFETD